MRTILNSESVIERRKHNTFETRHVVIYLSVDPTGEWGSNVDMVSQERAVRDRLFKHGIDTTNTIVIRDVIDNTLKSPPGCRRLRRLVREDLVEALAVYDFQKSPTDLRDTAVSLHEHCAVPTLDSSKGILRWKHMMRSLDYN